MAKSEKKEKPVPKKCVCGRGGIIVKSRAGKMISCPDPLNCKANLRTIWHSHEESAIAEWNGLVDSFSFQNKNRRQV
jgi:ssDNA-binding Zn-finger/Zn-ribbon topoisomerase 1